MKPNPDKEPMPRGLTPAEAAKRLKQDGKNEIVSAKKVSVASRFLARFRSPLVLILIAAAVVSGVTGDAASAIIIVVIVILSALLDFANTYKAEKATEELKARVRVQADVFRDGRQISVPVTEIVTGDVIALTPGDVIPADGLVAHARDFFVNESVLTGESFPIEKEDGAQIFMGSSAVSGHAIMTATATGAKTKFSAIAASLQKREAPNDFDRNISKFSYLVMRVTFALVIFVFFVNAVFRHNFLESFLFSVALAVGLTPELLPMIIALNLSKGSLKMAKHGVIVKKLSAIENFGSMDTLCSDKTGTLTEGQIALVKYVDGAGAVSERVLLHAYLSSSYHTGFDNPFDAAVREHGKIDIKDYAKIDEIPFDFVRRRDSIVVEHGDKRLLIAKGAPEEIFEACRFYENSDTSLDAQAKARATDEYRRLSQDGFRVLAIAVRELSDRKEVYSKHDEKDLIFIGYTAFLDPPKKSVTETLRLMKTHGVEIKIVTGDNELVTQKIAADINLNVKGTLLGSEIEKLTEEALCVRIEQTTIFARVNPMQKERIILTLQKNGHVVGYIGDGVNDAPSLRAADVGISVDNATDVAKDSADLILLKRSLRDLINGIIEGRRTYANTLKYLMMGLSSNFGNMFSMAGASVLLPFLPMLPTQILMNNLLYDASQFTIPLDEVDADTVKSPRRLDLPFLKRFMFVFGLLSSVFDFCTFGALYLVFRLDADGFQTGWFLESLATQTLVIYVIRTKRLPFFQSRPSPYLFWSVAAAVFVGWSVALSFIGTAFGFSTLPLPVLFTIGGIVAVYLILAELIKRWFYRCEARRTKN